MKSPRTLLEELADATLDGTRKIYLAELAAVPLLIIDDLGMRKLPHTAAEDHLEIITSEEQPAFAASVRSHHGASAEELLSAC